MGRIKYVVVFLLLLMSCKQYNEEVGEKSKVLKAKVGNEVGVEGEGKEEVKKTAEEALREKLNEKQKEGLDFLKEALGDEGKFNKLLGLEETKVKAALDHIQKQLESCTGDKSSEQKGTFKATVKASLGGSDTNLGQLTSAESLCDTAGSGTGG